MAAAGSHNLTIRHLVLDTVRLPFSAVTVVAASADGREIGLRLAEPDRSEFNTAKYPWLRTMSFSCTDLDPPFTRDPHLELPRVELGPAVFSVERASGYTEQIICNLYQ